MVTKSNGVKRELGFDSSKSERDVQVKPSHVMGIDPSLTGTAVCLMTPPEHFVMHRFTSKPAMGVHDRMERFTSLVDGVLSTIDAIVPKLVVIEGYSFASQGAMQLDRIEYGGILRYELDARGYNIVEVPPTSLKKFCCGKGNGDKTGVISALTKRYGVEFHTNDEYDAMGLALLGMCLTGLSEPHTKAQADVIKRIGAKVVW